MKVKILLLVILSVVSSYSLDHLYLIRTGFGASTFTGPDAPSSANPKFSYVLNAQGAQSFYGGGPLWGTEISVSSSHVQFDTLVWNQPTGNFDKKGSYELSWIKPALGVFLMKSWDFGLNISAGPQVAYLLSCTRTLSGKSRSCADDFQNMQLEAQAEIQYIYGDLVGVDFKWVQSALPVESSGGRQVYQSLGSIGVSYIF